MHGFSDASKEKVLPGSAAGFARRQAHHLTTMTSPNLSLSISVEPL
jgi:hypothetical protein